MMRSSAKLLLALAATMAAFAAYATPASAQAPAVDAEIFGETCYTRMATIRFAFTNEGGQPINIDALLDIGGDGAVFISGCKADTGTCTAPGLASDAELQVAGLAAGATEIVSVQLGFNAPVGNGDQVFWEWIEVTGAPLGDGDFSLECPTVDPNRQLGCQIHLPILNFQGQDDVCETWIEVQNLGCEFAKASLVTWGEPGFCPPQAAGPLKVECTGLIKPGSTWNILGAQIPTGSKGGMLFKFSAKQLSASCRRRWPSRRTTSRPTTSARACSSASSATRTTTAASRRPTTRAWSSTWCRWTWPRGDGLLAVDVHRTCPGDVTPGVSVTRKYNGIAGTHLGVYDEVFGGYGYYVPLVYADKAGYNTIIYIQNGGLNCSSLEMWFQAQDDCLRAKICDVATLAPGETYQMDANDCVGPDFQGSVWIRSSQVMGIAVDIIGRDVLMTYIGEPAEINYSFDPNGAWFTAGNQVAFAPLIYSEYQGWDTGIQVQNLSAVVNAKVKVYFLDRGRRHDHDAGGLDLPAGQPDLLPAGDRDAAGQLGRLGPRGEPGVVRRRATRSSARRRTSWRWRR